MPFCTPVLWPPLHYWSVHRWDSKYPLVCQKNETDDAVWVQYRICVVDDVAGLPILLLAYAATKESIEKDWSVVQGALRGLKDATSYNVCKEVLSRLHLGNPSVKSTLSVCFFVNYSLFMTGDTRTAYPRCTKPPGRYDRLHETAKARCRKQLRLA